MTKQELLTSIYEFYEKYKSVEIEECKGFNIFSILNIERKEVLTHSHFIYELLNPHGSHNQGVRFLELFLKYVLGIEDYGNIKAVKREDLTANGKRIDFTIETSKYQIAIEMKIDTSDLEDQLKDYLTEIQRRAKPNKIAKIYYLTLAGDEPSPKSIGKQKDKKEFINIERSFSFHILRWLDSCIDEIENKVIVKELLHQYKALIEKITDQNKGIEMDVVGIINDKKENFIAAHEVYRDFETASAILELEFWKSVISELQNEMIKMDISEITIDEIIRARKKNKETNLYFEIDREIGIWLQIGYEKDEEGIYCTIYKEMNGEWVKEYEEEIVEALNKVTMLTFNKPTWAYGYAKLGLDIQLRNEYLFDAQGKVNELVDLIRKLIPEVMKAVGEGKKLLLS